MSNHVREDDVIRWVVGWNQKFLSFFLTKHDKSLEDSENPVVQLGSHLREIPDADGLFVLANMVGFDIPQDLRAQLYLDRDQESRERFVLYYPGEFVHGFRTEALGHAETLKDGMSRARPNEELQIRRVLE